MKQVDYKDNSPIISTATQVERNRGKLVFSMDRFSYKVGGVTLLLKRLKEGIKFWRFVAVLGLISAAAFFGGRYSRSS